MLIKLQPEQIDAFWDSIKLSMIQVNGIADSDAQDYSIRILQSLFNGNLQCWVLYEQDGENKQLHAIATTEIVERSDYGSRTLYIHTLYGFATVTDQMVSDGMEKIVEYAIANKCTVIEARTSVERVKEFLVTNQFNPHQVIYRRII